VAEASTVGCEAGSTVRWVTRNCRREGEPGQRQCDSRRVWPAPAGKHTVEHGPKGGLMATGGEIDARSDVYGLGCLLYEMLTGEPPFTGATAQAVLARHLQERARPIRSIRPDVPPQTDQVIFAALNKSPGAEAGNRDQVSSAVWG
jgi:serine/threonine protein kinase